jgi:hypothetical protein
MRLWFESLSSPPTTSGPETLLPSHRTAAPRGSQGVWEGRANCGGNPCNFFSRFTHSLSHSFFHAVLFTMEGENITPYQDGDTTMHRAWLVANASANTIEGTPSDPGSGSTAARPPRPDPFQFDGEFLAVGHSGGRGTRGSRGNSGHGGRARRGRSSGSSTDVNPASRPESPPRDVPQGSEHGDRRGLKRPAISEGTEDGSAASGSQSRKRKNRGKRDPRIDEARTHCRIVLLEWFRNNSMVYLEKKYLNDGTKGLELARNELMLILTEATAGQAFEEARGMSDWNTWIEQQAVEAIYNPTMTYEAVHPGEGSSGGRKSELYIKLENWKRGVIAAKGTSARNLPVFIDRQMADNIATQGRQGVIWLPRNAEIKALDREIFQGTFGVVRRVQIHGASFIPSWIEWAGKTMKAKNSLENRKERSLEALACPVDHPGVIKLQYLNPRTKESYSMWWNGGSLKNMRIYDHQVPEDHERDILQMHGADFEARKRLVVYRKHRAYLAWALMCIVDVVHNQDVLHNDLNPNNVMLHFPQDRENTVFIGVCDWGMASWGDEDAPSNYGRDSVDDMKKHREKYNCAGPELFHVRGQRGTSTSPVRMARKHRHTYLSESFSVGVLAKKIYAKDAASPLFQLNSDPNGVMMRFELALDQLTRPNPAERSTITHIVNILKSPPYNIVTPTMCFRDTAK